MGLYVEGGRRRTLDRQEPDLGKTQIAAAGFSECSLEEKNKKKIKRGLSGFEPRTSRNENGSLPSGLEAQLKNVRHHLL